MRMKSELFSCLNIDRTIRGVVWIMALWLLERLPCLLDGGIMTPVKKEN